MKSSVFPLPNAKALLGFAWAIAIVVLFLLALDSIIARPGTDSSIFIYVAQGILEGDIPYLDRWDHKGPLLYLLNAIGLVIDETWGILFVQGLFLLGSASFAFLLLRRSFGILSALFALAIFLAYYRSFAWPGNFTEQFGLLFQFVTLYVFARSQEQATPESSRGQFAWLHIGIGTLGAASFLLRPDLVALWIAIGIYWLLIRGNSLGKIAWAVLGGVSVLFPVAAIFAALGSWDALWDAGFIFNFAHTNVSLPERLHVVRNLTAGLFPASVLGVAGWLIGLGYVASRKAKDEPRKSLLVLALILLPLEVAGASLSGFVYAHYFLTTLPVVTLLLAFLVWFTLRKNLIAPTLLTVALLVGAFYFSLPLSNFARLAEKYTADTLIEEDRESLVAARVREATEPGDRILVWGKAARIYLLADRNAPTRYFYHHPLVKPHYTTESMRDEFLLDLKNDMPVLIIDSRYDWFAPLNRSERAGWQPHERYMHNPADFGPFFDFVEANYVAIETTLALHLLRPQTKGLRNATTAQRRIDCPLHLRCVPGRQNPHLRKEPVRPR